MTEENAATGLLDMQFKAIVSDLRGAPDIAEVIVSRAIYLLTGLEYQDDALLEQLLMHRTKAEVSVALLRGAADIIEQIEAKRLDSL